MSEKRLYTVIVFSENTVGLLNQVTVIFTRRRLNIETISASPSAIAGIHKCTITTYADQATIEKVVKLIDKRVDVIKSYYHADEDIIHQELALYKVSTPLFLKMQVEELIRRHNARVLSMDEHSVIIEKNGHQSETQELFEELNRSIGVLQFVRSGRIALTKGKMERLSDMIAIIQRGIEQEAAERNIVIDDNPESRTSYFDVPFRQVPFEGVVKD